MQPTLAKEGKWGGDHFVARPHLERHQRHQQGIGARRQPDRATNLKSRANSRSKPSTSGPRMKPPPSMTRAVAARIASRKGAFCGFTSSKGTFTVSPLASGFSGRRLPPAFQEPFPHSGHWGYPPGKQPRSGTPSPPGGQVPPAPERRPERPRHHRARPHEGVLADAVATDHGGVGPSVAPRPTTVLRYSCLRAMKARGLTHW